MSMGMAVMMVMPAMFVMVMTMAMVMIGMVMGRMSVCRMVMRFTGRRVRVTVTGIGAAFRIERRFDLNQAGPQTLHHRFDHVVAPDAQAACGDLRRQVTIAEMPGDANQMLRIAAADFH